MAKIAKRRGRYVADYYSLDGRRQRKSFTLRKDSEGFLAERVQEAKAARTGQRPLKEATFGEYAQRWLENHSVGLKPWTAEFYERMLRVHLVPRFGQRSLQDIDREAVAGFKANVVRSGKWSPRTVNHILTTLKTVLNNAAIDGYISSSPASSVKPVKVVTEEKDFLKTRELRLFQDHASPKFRTLFLCAILTGMRQGELLALHWDCVDFASMQIRVRRGLYKGAFIEPKSASSRRDIDMAPMLAQALRESPSRFKGKLVPPQANGKPMSPNNLRNREFKPTLRRAGLRDLPFHSLRDSYAALMIQAGHHPKYIQSQMGHASIRMTLDLYGHLMEQTNPEASMKLQETFLEEPKLQGSGHKMVTEKQAGN